jgi:hypothetical protein
MEWNRRMITARHDAPESLRWPGVSAEDEWGKALTAAPRSRPCFFPGTGKGNQGTTSMLPDMPLPPEVP